MNLRLLPSNGTEPSPLDRKMHKPFLWILILGLIGFLSGCAMEKYHQIPEDHTGLNILRMIRYPAHNLLLRPGD